MNLFSTRTPSSQSFQSETSRLLTAAVVNQRFRKMLLSNPAQALATGYGGEVFHMEKDVRDRVSAIRANSLEDFARQLTNIQDFSASKFAYAGD